MAGLLRIWLLLGVCLILTGAPVQAATGDGLLAVIEATEGGPAVLILRRDAGPEILRATLPVRQPAGHAISPDGRHLVYYTGTIDYDLGESSPDVALNVWRIAGGETARKIPLLPAGYPANIAENVRRVRAVVANSDFVDEETLWPALASGIQVYAWSPDGTRLAYGSAQEGPSSDLYVYDTRDDTVLRLTDGPEQINEIRWSPDGRLIWHNTISYGMCQTCDGHKYVAAADGSGVTRLHGDEVDRFLGWVGPTTYVETDQANGPGDFGLRLVDVSEPQVTTLWPGVHQQVVLDLATDRLLVQGWEGTQWQADSYLFLIDLLSGDYHRLDEPGGESEATDLMAILDHGVAAPCEGTGFFVSPCTPRGFDPLSPNGRLRVEEDGGVYTTADGAVYLPPEPHLARGAVYWQADGAGYFVRQGANLFHREIETGQSQLLHSGVSRVLWLPEANGAALPMAGVKANDLRPPADPAIMSSPPEIPTIASGDTLAGSTREVAHDLRVAQAEALAVQALDSRTIYGAWRTGLPLLLAQEAVRTTTEPVWDLFPAPAVLPAAESALRTVVAEAPPWVASFPRGGRLPETSGLAVHPSGAWIATGHTDGTLRLWDPATGTMARTFPLARDRLQFLAFSDSGRYLIAADAVGRSYLWNVQTGYTAATHVGRYSYTYALAWRPGQETWLIANGDEPVMGRAGTGAPWVVYEQPGEALAFSPDGSRLAIALRPEVIVPSEPIRTAQSPTPTPIVVIDPDTGEDVLRIDDDGMTYLLTYSPDGATLISGTATKLRFWDAATGELNGEAALAGLPGSWTFPAPDQLAVLSYRTGLTVYDLPNGDVARSIRLDGFTFSGLASRPGRETLITSGGGRPIWLDAATGDLDYPFDAPETGLMVANPVRPWIATSNQGTVAVRDMTTQATVYELEGLAGEPEDLAFSQDGSRLAAVEATGYLTVWEMERGRLLWRVQAVEDELVAVAFAADGRIVVSEHGTPRLLVVNGETGQVDLARPLAETAWMLGAGAEGKIAAATATGAVDVYSLANLAADPIALGDPDDRVEALTVNLAGDRLAISWRSGVVDLWDTGVGELVARLDVPGALAPDALAFSVDGARLATGATSVASVMLWDGVTGIEVRNVTPPGSQLGTRHLGFSPDGTRLAVADGMGVTQVFGLSAWRDLRSLWGHAGSVWDVAVSPDGRRVVTAGDDRTVRVWHWQTGEEMVRFPLQPDRVYSVDVSPQGDRVVTAGFDGEARFYDLNGGIKPVSLPVDEGWIETVVFSPDGDEVAAATSHGAVWVWNSTRGGVAWRQDGLGRGSGALAYSPDGSRLAGAGGSGDNTALHVWDAATGVELATLEDHTGYVAALAYSPDGRLLASASWDKTIRLWDAVSYAPLATLEGHTEVLTDLAFSPDGRRLASVAEDHTLRIWHVVTGMELDRIDLGPALPWSVDFTTDGAAMITAHADGVVRTWLADPNDDSVAALLARAAGLTPRAMVQFTPAERQSYGVDAYVGAYALSASGNVNVRGEPVVRSLVVRPGSPERLEALTDEGFLLASTDRGEKWAILARLPLTVSATSLAIPARAEDSPLVATRQGLFRFDENDGRLYLVHDQPMVAVSYSHTNPDELWAVSTTDVLKSEDGGRTWGKARNNLSVNLLYGPLLMAAPNNNPQVVVGSGSAIPSIGHWRGTGNGFWEYLPRLPVLPLGLAAGPGMAWDGGNRTLYMGGDQGQLYATNTIDAPKVDLASATVVYDFGTMGRPVPLAVGAGPTLYVTLWAPHGPRLLRGTWDGETWTWLALRLPIVAAG